MSQLIPTTYNPRRLSEKEASDLKESLKKFNLAELPVINADNTLLAGHQRCKILASLHSKKMEIEVRVASRLLTKEEADEYLIRSNRNTGNFDYDMLANHFEQSDLLAWGFSEKEIDFFKDAEAGMPDLPTGEKGDLEQITFTLHKDQALIVREAVDKAKALGIFDQALNQNSNGNALERICEAYVNQV